MKSLVTLTMGHLVDQSAYTTSQSTFNPLIDDTILRAGCPNLLYNGFCDLCFLDFVDFSDRSCKNGVDRPVIGCTEFCSMICLLAELYVSDKTHIREVIDLLAHHGREYGLM